MTSSRRWFTTVCTPAILVGIASPALGAEQWEKCLDRIYNTTRKVYDQEQKNNRKSCVKNKTGSQQACIDAEQVKSEDQRTKLEALFDAGAKCDPIPPFGLDSTTGTEVADAAQAAADAIARAIFGDAVDGLDASKCQDKLVHRSGQAGTHQWKATRSCAKRSHADIAAIETCIVTGLGDAKALAKFDKLQADIEKHCVTFPVPGTDDGDCAAETTAAGLRTCIEQATTCTNCRTMNAITGGKVDCAAVSGDPACSEPPPFGVHSCVLDPAESEIDLPNQALPLAPFSVSGRIDIRCGAEGMDGKAACDCELQSLSPIDVVAIGHICFMPGEPCATGEIDCDGGNGLDVVVDSDHNIGTCTGHLDCAAQCATYCAGQGAQVTYAGCEGFCTQPPHAPCTVESDCLPDDGTCPGRENSSHGNICGCECVAVGGDSSRAGGLHCNLSMHMELVYTQSASEAPCQEGTVASSLGQRCVPLTTETRTSRMLDTNGISGKTFPFSGNPTQGEPISCAGLVTGTTTGLVLVGSTAFFDQTIGDIQMNQTFTCQ